MPERCRTAAGSHRTGGGPGNAGAESRRTAAGSHRTGGGPGNAGAESRRAAAGSHRASAGPGNAGPESRRAAAESYRASAGPGNAGVESRRAAAGSYRTGGGPGNAGPESRRAAAGSLHAFAEPDSTAAGPGNAAAGLNRRFCVAPMMSHTDRHFRYLLRLLSRRAMLYTEMLTTGALLHGDAHRHLRFHALERPVGIQLGGSRAEALAACARLAEDYGYDEVNLNVGCPSKRVKSGRFGACLMAEPALVADCARAMADACGLPVTVKTRLGIDGRDRYEHLVEFVGAVAAAGCRTFIIHARKAWLQGLSPRQNRSLPPLRRETVHRLKQDFPQLEIIINGGIQDLAAAQENLRFVDGVMLGRAVCHNPYLLAEVDKTLFGVDNGIVSRRATLVRFMDYMETEMAQGESLRTMARHLPGLFRGQPGARAWRRFLGESAWRKNAGLEVIRQALSLLSEGEARQAEA